jgi:hypothetical protein
LKFAVTSFTIHRFFFSDQAIAAVKHLHDTKFPEMVLHALSSLSLLLTVPTALYSNHLFGQVEFEDGGDATHSSRLMRAVMTRTKDPNYLDKEKLSDLLTTYLA